MSMELHDIYRTIGQLEAAQEASNREVAATRAEIHELRKQMAAMLEILQTAKGGWRMLIGVGSVSAAAGGILVKVLSLLPGVGK